MAALRADQSVPDRRGALSTAVRSLDEARAAVLAPHRPFVACVANHFADHGRERYPFRDRFEHTLRVYAWTRRLAGPEGADPDVCGLAALYHDTGWEPPRPHAEVSAEIAARELAGERPTAVIERVTEVILAHSSKELAADGLTMEQRVLMDADLLDEVGATAVLFDAMATASDAAGGSARPEESATYRGLLTRIERIHAERLVAHRERLKTRTGRRLYEERLAYHRGFIAELRLELGLD